MNDGVGMTPEDEGTDADGASGRTERAPKHGQGEGTSPDQKTSVTGWTGGTNPDAGSPTTDTASGPGFGSGASGAASRGSGRSGGGPSAGSGTGDATTDLRSAGADTVYTEDPAMADQPVEGGVEEAER